MSIPIFLQAVASDGAVHITLGTGIVVLIANTLIRELRDRRNGNGKGPTDAEYWERMETRVTKPIVEALRELKR